MNDALVGGLLALAGVLLASGVSLISSRLQDQRAARRARQGTREETYAAVIAAQEAMYTAALMASARHDTFGPRAERTTAAFHAIDHYEAASFRAWLLAGPAVRAALDDISPKLRSAALETMGRTAEPPPWPGDEVLREAMGQEVRESAA